MRTLLAAAAAALALLPPLTAGAQPAPPRQDRVAFARNATSAIVKGQLKGDVTVVKFESGEFYEIVDAMIFGG